MSKAWDYAAQVQLAPLKPSVQPPQGVSFTEQHSVVGGALPTPLITLHGPPAAPKPGLDNTASPKVEQTNPHSSEPPSPKR